jgi:hypothetical protein
MCFILSDLKNVMGVQQPQTLEIIFEVQTKMSNEKNSLKKIKIPTYKMWDSGIV